MPPVRNLPTIAGDVAEFRTGRGTVIVDASDAHVFADYCVSFTCNKSNSFAIAINILLYGLVGPYINAGPYIESTNRVGLHAEVGGSINAFGAKLPAMPRFVLADISTPL